MSNGVPNPPDWYTAAFGPRTTEKVLYLTYDDGPWPPYTDQVLSLLAENDAKATFFVTGNQAQQHPSHLQRIIEGGHAIGDHSTTHADLVGLNRDQIRAELGKVKKIVGPSLGACMRPPYGLIDTKVAEVSADLNLMPILWTAHAQDWAPGTVSEMVEMLKKGTEPGAVILLHDSAGKEKTISATRQMLPWWTSQGYRFETVPACRVG
jgi:peptidoglycan/xylan/chitin deacetylase (PgdA/CDA1 family)